MLGSIILGLEGGHRNFPEQFQSHAQDGWPSPKPSRPATWVWWIFPPAEKTWVIRLGFGV